MKPKIQPEQVGRKYQRTRFEIHTRAVGSDGWFNYGTTFYDEATARVKLSEMLKGSRYHHIGGGLTLDTGPDTGERYERRLVRVDSQNEVLEVGIGQ